MNKPITKPTVSLASQDCRDGGIKCALGRMGCTSIQISGQPALSVAHTHATGSRTTTPVAPLGPGQYDVVVVGDFPTIEDDRIGMMWSDENGKKIIQFLQQAGHDLGRV